MPGFKDLTGVRFGRLTVLKLNTKRTAPGTVTTWLCKCDCGTTKVVRGGPLAFGTTRSCGCLHREELSQRMKGAILAPVAVDLTGKKFGRLLVIRRNGSSPHQEAVWLCLCECGAFTNTTSQRLKSGNTKSCGCYALERRREAATKHGQCGTSEWRSWSQMTARCTNSKHQDFKHYGGRGIQICERWKAFELFLQDMGRKPTPRYTIERKNNDGNYEPGNCIWATQKRQTRNQRRTRWLTLNGVTMAMADWSEAVGISYTTIRRRLGYGWSDERALTTPVAT